ncbi:hypothetical protein LOTGIDRAFT_203296 [Lottia gigantea]|uniref:GST N-terminal domain-containing protein n=1 Tax=Lottia gigantea TaxID=225164 RepID=V4B2Q6_LOTGI|nr:hypothetical protein LOTGIDRAFT_203296 [Lottia gigantea]ESO82824.1 hypothetical protein LOTGIDRAFT_203296 [Lottia gigantea]
MDMKNRFTLYYFPTSYYSHLVLIALEEKQALYKEKIINFLSGEQLKVKFVRLYYKCEIPVLTDGDKVVVESKDIVDYIDKEVPTEPKLVPDKSSEIGKEVERVRGILGRICMEYITYGCLFYPELSHSGLKLPKAFLKTRKEIEDAWSTFATTCAELADKHPDLRDAYLTKNQYFTKKISLCSDKVRVQKAIDDLDKVFEQMETLLIQNKKDGVEETWIVGPTLTAADISLATLIGRAVYLGLDSKLFSRDKRPEVYQYWTRISERSSIKKTVLGAAKATAQYMLKQKAKIVLPVIGGLATVGLAAGVAALLIAKKYT